MITGTIMGTTTGTIMGTWRRPRMLRMRTRIDTRTAHRTA
jgi:hypothetical protein